MLINPDSGFNPVNKIRSVKFQVVTTDLKLDQITVLL